MVGYITSSLLQGAEGVQIFFDLVDYDRTNADELVDRFAINVTLAVGSCMRKTYSGIFSAAEVNISLTLRCAENYYDSDCNRFCNENIAQLLVTLHSFSNPEGKCADTQCSQRCCEGACPQDRCHYYLHYCQRVTGTPVSYEHAKYQGNCSALNATTENLNTQSFMFSKAQSLLLPLKELVSRLALSALGYF